MTQCCHAELVPAVQARCGREPLRGRGVLTRSEVLEWVHKNSANH